MWQSCCWWSGMQNIDCRRSHEKWRGGQEKSEGEEKILWRDTLFLRGSYAFTCLVCSWVVDGLRQVPLVGVTGPVTSLQPWIRGRHWVAATEKIHQSDHNDNIHVRQPDRQTTTLDISDHSPPLRLQSHPSLPFVFLFNADDIAWSFLGNVFFDRHVKGGRDLIPSHH